jgi:dTDP-4-dehydrorhamnose reductase
MKKVLLIGENGQVTTYLQGVLSEGYQLQVAGRHLLDLSKLETIDAVLERLQPDFIINPAAYTAVDAAETDAEMAFKINRDAVAIIATYCARSDTPLIHFSTDYVFSGDADQAYLESDQTGPTGVYGQSKLEGENAILASGAPAIILRTAWVYSTHGKNFYKTMLMLSDSRDELSVVGDQIGAPTYAGSIAEATKQLVDIVFEQGGLRGEQQGLYHFTCQGQTSWAEFAKSIFIENEISTVNVTSITTDQYPTPAKRPAYSVLNGDKLNDTFGIALPHWGTALAHCAAEANVL